MIRIIVSVVALFAASGLSAPPLAARPAPDVSSAGSPLPSVFIENRGQWDNGVLFRLDAGEAVLWFTEGGVWYQLVGAKAPVSSRFVGANPHPTIIGAGPTAYRQNYFYGSDSSAWVRDVAAWRSIEIEEVYPGVDVRYYISSTGQVEYDIIVAPGGNPDAVLIAWDGIDDIDINPGGELVISAPGGTIVQTIPRIFQNADGGAVEIAGRFAVIDSDLVGFETAAIPDPTLALVIDPILRFSSYLGGSLTEAFTNMTTDPAGNVYVTGYSTSTDFPTVNAYDATLSRRRDIVVSKIAPGGTDLLYSTYIGGTGDDEARGLALDAAGNIYLCGTTLSTDFPVVGAFDNSANGENDAFVLKLAAAGNALVYSTYLGGTEIDIAEKLVVDADGYACLVGQTESPDFPVRYAIDATTNGSTDAFIARLAPNGASLAFASYLGGSATDAAKDIRLRTGGVLTAGLTSSPAFPTTAGAYDVTYNGGSDIYLTAYSWLPTGATIAFSTFVGGAGAESDRVRLAYDPDGAIWVAGQSSSADFPTVNAWDDSYNGNGDVILAKLTADGSALVYSSFFGGSGADAAYAMFVDSDYQIYLTGWTGSTDLPLMFAVDSVSVGSEAFVARFDTDGSALVYATLLGGSGDETGYAICPGPNSSVYVAGQTGSVNFPTALALDAALGGISDGFISRLTGISNVCCEGDRGNVNNDDNPDPNVADLTYLVGFLFQAGTAPSCEKEADVNGSGAINVADLTYLVAYLFQGGPSPAACP